VVGQVFNRTTSQNRKSSRRAIAYHNEDGDNMGSQPDDMPDNQSGTLCTGSKISYFKNVESDKEGINKSTRLVG